MLAAAFVPHGVVYVEAATTLRQSLVLKILLALSGAFKDRAGLQFASSHRLNAQKRGEDRRHILALLACFFDCAGTPFGTILFRGLGLVFRPALTAAKKRRCASSSLY